MNMTLAALVPRQSDYDRVSSLALMLRSRALSAFTRVHSPSKTGVNALNDALSPAMTTECELRLTHRRDDAPLVWRARHSRRDS